MDEVKVLTTQVSFLEEEVAALRSRLADSPRQTALLEQRLREPSPIWRLSPARTSGSPARCAKARDQIIALKEEVDRLASRRAGSAFSCKATETARLTSSPRPEDARQRGVRR